MEKATKNAVPHGEYKLLVNGKHLTSHTTHDEAWGLAKAVKRRDLTIEVSVEKHSN
jgi:DNA-binding HxlR family transcriptional regulator